MSLSARQAYALAYPLGSADLSLSELAPYRRVRRHPRGLLTTVLAVDR